MSGRRLVLITRRFWPLVGGAEIMMANLAAAFHARGVETTLLTARWQNDWPPEVQHRGVRVVRLPQPTTRVWGTWRYMRHLQTWLEQHRHAFDLVYVSMLKHDAYAAISAGRKCHFPVVTRAEGAGPTGDVHWQIEARFGNRIRRRCRQAAALIAPSQVIHRELVAAGYPRDRIYEIPNGVPIPPPRSAARRLEARSALGATNRALAVEPDDPLVVYTGRLHEAKGLERLVAAWPTVLSRHDRARLWLVGQGPLHRRLTDQISTSGLCGRVLLTGSFDDVADVLAAADVFVLPSRQEGLSVSLLEAMAAGLPSVATDIPGNRQLLGDSAFGRLVRLSDDPVSLGAAIADLLADPAASERLGRLARAHVEANYSLQQMVDAHLKLFDRLLENSQAGRRAP